MRLLPLCFLALTACASQSKSPATTPTIAAEPPAPVAAAPAAPSGPLSEAECSQAFARDLNLAIGKPEFAFVAGDTRANYILTCVAEFDRQAHFDCLMRAESKDQLIACQLPRLRAHPPASVQPALTCQREGQFGPFTVTAEQYLARTGAGATRFSQVAGPPERPLENCGVPGVHFQLSRMTCEDGSRPFKGYTEVEQARGGSIGVNGRCGSMIDRYLVRCPEQTYEIHTDLYVCLPDAWPHQK